MGVRQNLNEQDRRVLSNNGNVSASRTSLMKSGSTIFKYIKNMFPQKVKQHKIKTCAKSNDLTECSTKSERKMAEEVYLKNHKSNTIVAENQSRQVLEQDSISKKPILKRPYLKANEQIQLVSRCITEKRTYRKNNEKPSSIYKTNSDELKNRSPKNRSPTKKRTMKKSVLTLPTSSSKQTCPHKIDELECEACKTERMKYHKHLSRAEKRKAPTGDKLTTDSEKDHSSKASESVNQSPVRTDKNDILQMFSGKSECPTYVVSRKITPDRELTSHDVWNILREINRNQYKPSMQISDESLFCDPRPRRKPRKRRNNTQVVKTIEEIYLSSIEYQDTKKVVSNSSSVDCVTVVDLKELNENKPLAISPYQTNKYYNDKCIAQSANERLKVKFNNNDKSNLSGKKMVVIPSRYSEYRNNTLNYVNNRTRNKGDLELPKQNYTTKNESVDTATIAVTDIKSDASKSRYGDNRQSETMKYNKESNRFNNKRQISEDKTNKKAAASDVAEVEYSQVNSRKIKMTCPEIKKKIAAIKFPLIILGRDAVAEVTVPEYEAPQFASMNDSIWPFMASWSKNSHNDKTKYIKIIPRQIHQTMVVPEVIKMQKKKAVARKREKHNRSKPKPYYVCGDDQVLEVLFQKDTAKTDHICNENRQSRKKCRDETNATKYPINKLSNKLMKPANTNLREVRSSPERKAIIEIFVEKSKPAEPENYETIEPKQTCASKETTLSHLTTPRNGSKKAELSEILKNLERNQYHVYQTNDIDVKQITNFTNAPDQNKRINARNKNAYLLQSTDDASTESPTFTNNSCTVNEVVIPLLKDQRCSKEYRPLISHELPRLRKTRKKSFNNFPLNSLHVMPIARKQKYKQLYLDTSTNVPISESILQQRTNANFCRIRIPGFDDERPMMIFKSMSTYDLSIHVPFKNITIQFEVVNQYKLNKIEECLGIPEIPIIDQSFALCLNNYPDYVNGEIINLKVNNTTLPEQVCSLWHMLVNELKTKENIYETDSSNADRTNFKEMSFITTIPKTITTKNYLSVGHVHTGLRKILQQPKMKSSSRSLTRHFTNLCYTKTNYKKVNDASFLNYIMEDKRDLKFCEHFYVPSQYLSPKIVENVNIVSTGTIKLYYSCRYRNHWGSKSSSDDVIKLFVKIAKSPTVKVSTNSMVKLHKDSLPYLTFSITSSVLEKFVKTILNIDLEFFFRKFNTFGTSLMQLNSPDEGRILHPFENIALSNSEMYFTREDISVPRKSSSTSKIASSVSRIQKKLKHCWRNKTSVKEKIALHSNAKENGCPEFLEITMDNIRSIEDFVKVLGWDGKQILPNAINGQLASRVLSTLSEIKTWTRKLDSTQALLVLLLSNKPASLSLMKYYLALVQGIATKRISTAAELDLECEAIEHDAHVEKDDQTTIMEELLCIAKKTASENNIPFTDASVKALNSLVKRQKRLNPSYLKVMAKYVGLGLVTSPSN